VQLWLAHHDVVVDAAAGRLGDGTVLHAASTLPVGALVRIIHALAVLAALEAHGLEVDAPIPRGGLVPADILCGRIGAHGSRPASLDDLLAACSGAAPEVAVETFVARPLGFHVVRGGCATADAVGAVVSAWMRLTRGEPEPRLRYPTSAFVRRAWRRASRVVAHADDAPTWRGPGPLRNVGARLSTVLSPLAFGERAEDGTGLAIGDVDRSVAGALLVHEPTVGAAAVRDRLDDLLRSILVER
jgi:hypothetical protein